VARLSDQQLEGEQLSVEYDKVTRLSDQQLEELQLSIELDRVTSLSDRQFEETEIQDFEFNQIVILEFLLRFIWFLDWKDY